MTYVAPPHFRIPRNSEIVALNPKDGKVDVKPRIHELLEDDSVVEKIERFKTDGGVCGDAKIDDIRAMDILVQMDKTGKLRDSGLTDAELLAQINVALRRKFQLDKKRKIVGINPKRFKLVTYQASSESTV